jgi:HEAT repeat protein
MSAMPDFVTHFLDWFHLSMRLHHIEQVWQAIEDLKDELRFSISLVACDISRLRRLLWNGYFRESTTALGDMLYHLGSLPDLHTTAINAKFKRAFKLVAELLIYLRQNGSSIVICRQRYWNGIAISSSRAESAASALVNARMNERRQMRWSPLGAHRRNQW